MWSWRSPKPRVATPDRGTPRRKGHSEEFLRLKELNDRRKELERLEHEWQCEMARIKRVREEAQAYREGFAARSALARKPYVSVATTGQFEPAAERAAQHLRSMVDTLLGENPALWEADL